MSKGCREKESEDENEVEKMLSSSGLATGYIGRVHCFGAAFYG